MEVINPEVVRPKIQELYSSSDEEEEMPPLIIDEKEASTLVNGVRETSSVIESAKEPAIEDLKEEAPSTSASVKEVEVEKESGDGWEDLLGTGRIRKLVKSRGTPGTKPHTGDECKVRMSGQFLDKEVLPIQELEFRLSESEVVKVLDIVVPDMNLGEVCEVISESDFVYGDLGLKPLIPPKATLTLTIELLRSQEPLENMSMPLEERKAVGKRKKERGNFWYARNEHHQAVQCYRKAAEFFDDEGIEIDVPVDKFLLSLELQEVIDERIKTHNNMAQSLMKVSLWDSAYGSLCQVLKLDPNNEKALFRKSKILVEKGKEEEALEILRRVTRLYPNNSQAKVDLAKLIGTRKKIRADAEILSRRMLGLEKHEKESKWRFSMSKWKATLCFMGGLSATVGLTAVAINKFL